MKPRTMFVSIIAATFFVCGSCWAFTPTDPAHGDTSSGVDRTAASHPKGSCAHCHDTFDDSSCGVNELMLFAPNNPTSQTDNFCFQCHCDSASSEQTDMIANNDYGATFGGGTAVFTSIHDAFNPTGTYASSHDLATMQDYAKESDWGTWMTDDTNACLVCHDPHLSQKNFPVEINANGGVGTAIRRGDDVNDYPGDIWGDESSAISGRPEIVSDWTSGYIYQAPYYGSGPWDPDNGPFEPANDETYDGSNLPNFVEACAGACHKKNDVPHCDPVNWTLYTTKEWKGNPSRHGQAPAIGGTFGDLKEPYLEASRGSYVLSCTDCHEAHGSTNPTLLRTTVNGVSGLSTGGPGHSESGGYWYDWCQACHDLTEHPVILSEARCGDYVGCHMYTPDPLNNGGDHGYIF